MSGTGAIGRETSAALVRVAKDEVLAGITEIGTVAAGCRRAHVSRSRYYEWMREDPEFAAGDAVARAEFAESLEEEARRRAVEGFDDPVYQAGKLVGHKRKHSDLLLITLLNGAMPAKYQRTRMEVSGPEGGPIQVRHGLAVASLSDAELASIVQAALASQAARLPALEGELVDELPGDE